MFASAHAFVPDRPIAAPEPRDVNVRPASLLPLAVAEPCTYDTITSRAGFDALESEWKALWARAGKDHQLFLSFDWLWHWANHYLPDDARREHGPSLMIVTGRRNGQLVMIWPLVTERVAGITKLTFMGDPVSQYGDALVDDLDDRDRVLGYGLDRAIAASRAGIVRFRRVRADAVIAPLLKARGFYVTERQEAPFLDLSSAPTFEAYEARYSSQSRRNRRRQMRRLEERGPVAFEAHMACEAASDLARLGIALKRAWLKDRGRVSPAVASDRMRDFFVSALAAGPHAIDATASVIRSMGEAAAIEIAVRSKDRIAIHVIVFNLKFEKCAAGALLMENRIRAAHEAGFATFDLLAPGDEYKSYWADGAIAVEDMALPLSLAGRAYHHIYLGLLRNGLKKVLPHMPMFVRRALSGCLIGVAGIAQFLRFGAPGA